MNKKILALALLGAGFATQGAYATSADQLSLSNGTDNRIHAHTYIRNSGELNVDIEHGSSVDFTPLETGTRTCTHLTITTNVPPDSKSGLIKLYNQASKGVYAVLVWTNRTGLIFENPIIRPGEISRITVPAVDASAATGVEYKFVYKLGIEEPRWDWGGVCH